MATRVPKSSIVSTTKRVLPAGHPDLVWYDPNEVIVVGEKSEYKVSGTGVSSFLSGSLTSGSPRAESEVISESADVPQLSDIEDIQYVKYFDPVSKIEKLKVIIKIRNASKNKKDVDGVDARVYQPRGA
jgi:hypothetical protein